MKNKIKPLIFLLAALLLWLAWFYFFGDRDILSFKTDNCKNFSLQINTHVQHLYGTNYFTSLNYVSDSQKEVLASIEGGPKGGKGLPVGFREPHHDFQTPNLDYNDYHIRVYVSPKTFSRAQYEDIVSCLETNVGAINETINDKKKVPRGKLQGQSGYRFSIGNVVYLGLEEFVNEYINTATSTYE